MDEIKNMISSLSDEQFQEISRPIEEKNDSGNFYFELTDPESRNRNQVCLSFRHQIYRDWFKTEFKYAISVHLNDQNGPLVTVDQLRMEITREIDQSNYTVSANNTGQIYHVRTFKPGPSRTSCLVPVVVYGGKEFRFVKMCQSANG